MSLFDYALWNLFLKIVFKLKNTKWFLKNKFKKIRWNKTYVLKKNINENNVSYL